MNIRQRVFRGLAAFVVFGAAVALIPQDSGAAVADGTCNPASGGSFIASLTGGQTGSSISNQVGAGFTLPAFQTGGAQPTTSVYDYYEAPGGTSYALSPSANTVTSFTVTAGSIIFNGTTRTPASGTVTATNNTVGYKLASGSLKTAGSNTGNASTVLTTAGSTYNISFTVTGP